MYAQPRGPARKSKGLVVPALEGGTKARMRAEKVEEERRRVAAEAKRRVALSDLGRKKKEKVKKTGRGPRAEPAVLHVEERCCSGKGRSDARRRLENTFLERRAACGAQQCGGLEGAQPGRTCAQTAIVEAPASDGYCVDASVAPVLRLRGGAGRAPRKATAPKKVKVAKVVRSATNATGSKSAAKDLSWASRYSDATDSQSIPCELCSSGKRFSSWVVLATHLKCAHSIFLHDLVGTYIYKQAKHEGCCITPEEVACVGVADGAEDMFKCLVCCGDAKPLKKRSARDHFLKLHGADLEARSITADSIRNWVVAKEGVALRNGTLGHVSLTVAIHAYRAAEIARAAMGCADAGVAGCADEPVEAADVAASAAGGGGDACGADADADAAASGSGGDALGSGFESGSESCAAAASDPGGSAYGTDPGGESGAGDEEGGRSFGCAGSLGAAHRGYAEAVSAIDERCAAADHDRSGACAPGSPGAKLLASLNVRANNALDREDLQQFEYYFAKADRLMLLRGSAAGPASSSGQPSHAVGAQPKQLPKPPAGATQHPKVSIRQEAFDFQKRTKAELAAITARKVYVWPLSSTCGLDLAELKDFIVSRTKGDDTALTYLQGVEYFFALFDFDCDAYDSLLSLYKQLYAEGLISRVMTLSILDPSIPWAGKIVAGMALCVDFLGIKAEDCGDEKGVVVSDSFRKRFLVPLKSQLPKAKDVRGGRRKRIDQHRRLQLASVEKQGEAVNWALIDLGIICDENIEEFEKTGSVSPAIRRVLNANGIGVYSWRTYPGRPGELEQFPLDRMEEHLGDPESWYVRVTLHKTEMTHGDMGRYIPPELREVLVKFVKFSCKKRNLLFVPAREDTEHISVNKAATDWACVYTPGCQHAEPTLLRKNVETEIAARENVEKAARMNKRIPADHAEAKEARVRAARMAGHLVPTANKYYILDSGAPELDAETSRAYIAEFKGPLPPLTEAQLAAKGTRTTRDILSDFARLATRSTKRGGDGEACGEECGAEAAGAEAEASGADEEGLEEVAPHRAVAQAARKRPAAAQAACTRPKRQRARGAAAPAAQGAAAQMKSEVGSGSEDERRVIVRGAADIPHGAAKSAQKALARIAVEGLCSEVGEVEGLGEFSGSAHAAAPKRMRLSEADAAQSVELERDLERLLDAAQAHAGAPAEPDPVASAAATACGSAGATSSSAAQPAGSGGAAADAGAKTEEQHEGEGLAARQAHAVPPAEPDLGIRVAATACGSACAAGSNAAQPAASGEAAAGAGVKTEKQHEGEGLAAEQGGGCAGASSADLSKADTDAIWAHAAVSRGSIFVQAEKVFIVKELRARQAARGYTDGKPLKVFDVEALIEKGIEEGTLLHVEEKKKFFERVRQFIKQFLKMSNLQAGPRTHLQAGL
jgi:hypothetical protein